MYNPEDLGQYLCPFTRKVYQLGYASIDEIQQALAICERSGDFLPQTLENITGKPIPVKLLREYKKYRLFELKIFYGVDSVDLDIRPVDINIMAELINYLIPIEVCRLYRLLPIARRINTIIVAMVNPDQIQALDDLQRRLQGKEMLIARKVIPYEDYEQLLSDFYYYQDSQKSSQIDQKNYSLLFDLGSIIDEISKEPEIADYLDAQDNSGYNLNNSNDDDEQAPVVRLVDQILTKALTENAAEIVVEPQEQSLLIFLRQEGDFSLAFSPLPKSLHIPVVNRIKIIADLNIMKRNIKQNGKIKLNFQRQRHRADIHIYPDLYGEKVIIKLNDNNPSDYYGSQTKLQTNVNPFKLRLQEIENLLQDLTSAVQELKRDLDSLE